MKWVLKYRYEADGSIHSIASRHNTDIATSGGLQLTLGSPGFDSIPVNWNDLPNALNYTLQIDTSSAFSSPTSQTLDSTSYTQTGLPVNSTRYFRVKASSGTGDSGWSNVVVGTTKSLNAPNVTAAVQSPTSINVSWPAVLNANSYSIDCSTDNTNWINCVPSLTATNYTFNGLAQGMPYYYRVKAVNGPFSSPYGTASAITSIYAPGAYNVENWDSRDAWNWLYARSDAICPAGTTPSYDWYYSYNGDSAPDPTFWVSGTQYQTVSFAMSWGTTLSLTVYSRCITSYASSAFVAGNSSPSKSLMWPQAAGIVGGNTSAETYWRKSFAYGSCPKYTDTFWYTMHVQGSSLGNTGTMYSTTYSPSTYSPSSGFVYSNTGKSWGDGSSLDRITCTGPWGTAASSDTRVMFGSGCVTATPSNWCYYPSSM